MDAHWFEDKDIESDDVLREIAAKVGLDPDEAIAAADDPTYLERLDLARCDAREHNVTGIPTIFFDNYPVVGCQPYNTLALVAERQGFERKA